MLLGGLWHGASWTYLLWGAWHGVFLVFERRLGKRSPYSALPLFVQVAVTFLIWTLGLVIFRSLTMRELVDIAGGLVGRNGLGSLPELGQLHAPAVVAMAIGSLVVFALPRAEQIVARGRPLGLLAALVLLLLATCQLLSHDFVSFIYYQF
jgi:alginate O-acetyltransferase complex protein AlgI